MAAAWPEEPFWDFSLRVYAQPGVEAACLGLQDQEGCDVNLLLLACWLAEQGVVLDEAASTRLKAAAGPWQAHVVGPLRRSRREVKVQIARADPGSVCAGLPDLVPAWRQRLASLELDAEHLEQLALARLARTLAGRGAPGVALAARNLRVLHAFRAEARAPLQALLRAAFPAAADAEVESALASIVRPR